MTCWTLVCLVCNKPQHHLYQASWTLPVIPEFRKQTERSEKFKVTWATQGMQLRCGKECLDIVGEIITIILELKGNIQDSLSIKPYEIFLKTAN